MKILLYHLTTDSDLKTGLQVCYKDTLSHFTQVGLIESTHFDGIPLYIVNGAAYACNELKLLAAPVYNSVKVIFENPIYNYETAVSLKSTQKTATQYFVGKYFDKGIYPVENMQQCIGIEFTDNNA